MSFERSSGGMDAVPFVLSLGSNLGDRAANLRLGVEFLRRRVVVDALSRTIESEPWGPVPQPPYLNLALRGHGAPDPTTLLAWAHEAELAAGRVRGERYGPRTLDVDIVLFGDLILETAVLTIPHPRWEERPFVRDLVAEVAGDLREPRTGRRIAELAGAGKGSGT
jgi:2-amino-4-hydroxy-6-hydroxymethyldihydropteridine diphosphokinase